MTGNATLLCFRDPGRQVRADDVKLRRFRAVQDADDVLFEPSCSLGCVGAHLLVTRHRGEIHVTGFSPPPPPLNVELARLYPRALDGPSPDRWPTPAEFNAPLGIPETASPMVERHRHAATLRWPEGPPTSAVSDDMPPAGVRAPAPPSPPQGPNLGLPLVNSALGGEKKPSANSHQVNSERNLKSRERFWSKVRQSDRCWLWTGSKSKGYGNFVLNGGHVYAHVLAWELTNGPTPEGYKLAHRPYCPRHCVRPEHWEPKTPQQITAAFIDRRNHFPMSLADRARAARAAADATGGPGDEALAAALEDAVAAECRSALADLGPDRRTETIPSPAESGYVGEVRIPPGAGAN